MTSCSFSHLILESNWVHYCLFQMGSCRVSFAFWQDNECGWGENSSHGWEGTPDTLVLPYWLDWFIGFRGHFILSNCSFSRLHSYSSPDNPWNTWLQTGASLKLTILNPKGRIWTMVAGGGASVIYSDTVIKKVIMLEHIQFFKRVPLYVFQGPVLVVALSSLPG